MLNNYTHVTVAADQEYTLCSAAEGKEITVLSLMINGGTNGSDITISVGDYSMEFTAGEDDIIVLDHKIVITTESPLVVKASAIGVKFSASVAELDAE